jgi:hypothetical protein
VLGRRITRFFGFRGSARNRSTYISDSTRPVHVQLCPDRASLGTSLRRQKHMPARFIVGRIECMHEAEGTHQRHNQDW